MKTFGTILRELRTKSKLTQKEFAYKVNVSSQVVSNWERGYSQANLEEIILIANVLNVSLDTLVGRSISKDSVLSDIEKKWMHRLSKLTDSQLDLILKLMDEMK
jgi:transcriptional regulator with XRE-family HTH domain